MPALSEIFDKRKILLYQNESLDLDHYYQEPYQDEMMKSRHKVSADLKNSRALLLRGSAIIRSRIYDYRYSSGSMERITSLV